jgi:hypothetical protein
MALNTCPQDLALPLFKPSRRSSTLTNFISPSLNPTLGVTFPVPTPSPTILPLISTTTTNFTPVFVSKPYAARRSSIAYRRPKSPDRPPPEEALDLERDSKMSRVLARRRENWRGVRSGALSGAEGKRVMWRGLFCHLSVLREEESDPEIADGYIFAYYA